MRHGVKFVVSTVALAMLVVPAFAIDRRPNIIVILADDMGFSDLGCFGGEICTPNLDTLAAGGLRFTQFYNTARCCPTRASLLTGLYPHQTGVGHMMGDKGRDGYRGDLNRRCVTIAEVLGSVGYDSYAVGKWHVTLHKGADAPQHNWPLQRGFDRFYGTIHGAGSFWDPSTLTRDNTPISAYADAAYQPLKYYYTDAISDHAVRFIEDHAKDHQDRPFFLYVAYTSAHWPLHAHAEDIAKYRHRYDSGYAEIRTARFEKAARLGLIDASQGMSQQAGSWEDVPDKEWEAACMEVYAAMVDRMDRGIGQIMNALTRAGCTDNSLVFYLQDNGGCGEDTGRSPRANHPDIERPDQPTLAPLSAATLLPPDSVPSQTRDGFPVRMGPIVMPGPPDTFLAYGRGWANVSNTPFREYKHWVHEGGISTPLIVHWPAGIKARGALRRHPGHLIDIMTTCLDVSGAEYPRQFKGVQLLPSEGRSLVPAFDDLRIDRDALYWEHERNRAVRIGDWKLVSKHGDDRWELYDLSKDRIESNDLASTHSKRVARMSYLWDQWAKRTMVVPFPNDPLTKPADKQRNTSN